MSPIPYDPQAIEARWRRRWADESLYRTPEGPTGRTFYCLDFFPYPSGDGLSVGHGRNYVPTDVISRFHRMQGAAVLHPMGWDAFGLPAENEAVRLGVHPQDSTTRYAANYRRQMTILGCSYDWEREINSSDAEFYRWTQWFFLLLHRQGLAYQDVGRQWWCPGCRTVLADEQVESGGTCWRCHQSVGKRDLKQWYFRITAYADELLASLATLDWPQSILAMQENWIGRSEGVEFELAVEGTGERFSVFTTRPDTVYGMTFAVLAPEHPLVEKATTPANREQVRAYCREAETRSEVDRLSAGRDGVATGAVAVNPVNGRRVPLYVADYVLPGYGGGAIMGVPAHDERDFDFARRHAIPAPIVIAPLDWEGAPLPAAYTEPGTMVNSGPWDGLSSEEAQGRIATWMENEGIGRRAVHYRLRDWLISRQRYWGAPIPIVHCDGCGAVPVPEEELPVHLPRTDTWQPRDDGRSPLANIPNFVRTACPACGRSAQRETDTMDGFACSSWYFLRFVSPHHDRGPFDPAALGAWGAPDLYVGGAEHAVMHLLYARFWTKVMADASLIPFREPFPVLRSQGVMHARDPVTGKISRMSKSAGNVVTPDSVAAKDGADALRITLLFMAPFENHTVWEEDAVVGPRRFLGRVWQLIGDVVAVAEPADREPTALTRQLHRTIRDVTADLDGFRFNTAVAKLMSFLNALTEYQRDHGVTFELRAACQTYVLLLAPLAPHIAEELWSQLGGAGSVHRARWPSWDETLVDQAVIELPVQVDGRARGRLVVPAAMPVEEIRALATGEVDRYLDGRRVTQVVVVPGRVVNVVTQPER
jgi:leucyl-tRNA synthetase